MLMVKLYNMDAKFVTRQSRIKARMRVIVVSIVTIDSDFRENG